MAKAGWQVTCIGYPMRRQGHNKYPYRAHQTTIDDYEKKRPDHDGLSEAIGEPDGGGIQKMAKEARSQGSR